jgi:chromosome segregation ATPase
MLPKIDIVSIGSRVRLKYVEKQLKRADFDEKIYADLFDDFNAFIGKYLDRLKPNNENMEDDENVSDIGDNEDSSLSVNVYLPIITSKTRDKYILIPEKNFTFQNVPYKDIYSIELQNDMGFVYFRKLGTEENRTLNARKTRYKILIPTLQNKSFKLDSDKKIDDETFKKFLSALETESYTDNASNKRRRLFDPESFDDDDERRQLNRDLKRLQDADIYLNIQIDELNEEIEELKQIVPDEAEKTFEKLQNELQVIKNQLDEKNKELEALKQQNRKYVEQLVADYDLELEKLRIQYNKEADKNLQQEANIIQLQKEKTDIENKINELNSQMSVLNTEKNSLVSTINLINENGRVADVSKINTLESLNERLKSELKEKEEEYAKLEEQLQNQQEDNELKNKKQFENQISDLKSKLDGLSKEKETLIDTVNKINQEGRESDIGKINTLESLNERLKSELKEKEEEYLKLEEQLQNQQEDNERLNALKKQFENQINELNSQMSVLNTEKNSLVSTVNLFNQEGRESDIGKINTLESLNERLKSELKEKEEEYANLEKTVRVQLEILEKKQQQNFVLNNRISQLEQVISDMRKQTKEISEDFEQQIAQLNRENAENVADLTRKLNEKQDELKEDNAAGGDDFMSQDGNFQDASKAKDLRAEIKELKAKLKEVNTSNRKHESDMKRIQENLIEMQFLKQNLKIADTKIKELEKALDRQQKDIDSKNKSIEILKDKNRALEFKLENFKKDAAEAKKLQNKIDRMESEYNKKYDKAIEDLRKEREKKTNSSKTMDQNDALLTLAELPSILNEPIDVGDYNRILQAYNKIVERNVETRQRLKDILQNQNKKIDNIINDDDAKALPLIAMLDTADYNPLRLPKNLVEQTDKYDDVDLLFKINKISESIPSLERKINSINDDLSKVLRRDYFPIESI